jgi:hypothetical protein
MTSRRKAEANRRNAQRSTGPRTAAGKARVAKNRQVIHGLVSTQVLLPGEDRATFDAFADALRRACNPEGAREEFLVDTMIAAGWRLRRLARMETDILSWSPSEEPLGGTGIIIYDPKNPPPEMMTTFYLPDNNSGPAPPPKNAEVSAKTEKPPLSVGLAFLQGCGTGTDAFTRLSRYEAGVERTFYRASHELERLQRARCGGLVPAPVSVDIITDGQERVDHNGILLQARSGPSGGRAAANRDTRPIEVTEVAETTIDAELLRDSATESDAPSP